MCSVGYHYLQNCSYIMGIHHIYLMFNAYVRIAYPPFIELYLPIGK